MTRSRPALLLLALGAAAAAPSSCAFAPTASGAGPSRASTAVLDASRSPAAVDGEGSSSDAPVSAATRRGALSRISSAFLAASALSSSSLPAFAAKSAYPQEDSDRKKIAAGYKRLNYLLDNWEKETTVCGRSDNPYQTGGGCERTPDTVMQYLGFRSTEDPLFRADKTLIRLQSHLPDSMSKEDVDAFDEALDVIVEKLDEGNGMAFVSSWGEANPGGGKDRVELFIERSKKDVIQARDGLGVIVRVLNL